MFKCRLKHKYRAMHIACYVNHVETAENDNAHFQSLKIWIWIDWVSGKKNRQRKKRRQTDTIQMNRFFLFFFDQAHECM